MPQEPRTFVEKVESALDTFCENDLELIRYRVKEESFSHRLALYLQCMFLEYKVDCEYDKFGEGSKKGFGTWITNSRTVQITIRPDIIVHRRGEQEHNLLAIELKKKQSPSQWDRRKLKRLTLDDPANEFNYKYAVGLFVGFSPEATPIKTWFQDGRLLESAGVLQNKDGYPRIV